ncbi:MarR family transcriptional regulator [Curtobacterium sp. MCBD17_035]|uniref:MarR family winged helix-turn-helix transcriptional regulator n=1 Tax=Curtobacterium sp. MCBD17_035 TaxID=2175673 RepID=UPI0011B47C4D|nr:MarR family transcriptional regulator [Curtobacterium sp. MCBD17_035]WIB66370.1 MarR family transcriptional regulator [Curtobacterium sp. MCBD17_035]
MGTADEDVSDLIAAFASVQRANAALMRQLSLLAGVHENALRALVLIDDTARSTPTEVAGFLELTSGAVTSMLDRLVAGGFIKRIPNPADRRGSLLTLEPAGQAVVAQIRRRYEGVMRAVDAEHRAGLYLVLNDLATGLLEQAQGVVSDAAAAGGDGT